jgi:NADH-quinone oxidoreductase subunit M
MGGLKRQMPIFSTLFLVAMLCNLGLPLTSGFVGEFLALLGSFQSGMSGLYGLKVVVAAVAGLGAIFSAAYMLYMFQRMFYGEAIDQREYKDINMTQVLDWAQLLYNGAVKLGNPKSNVFRTSQPSHPIALA